MVSSPSSSPRLAAALLLLAAGACRKEPPSPAPSPSPAPPASTRQSPEQAKNRLAELAEADRARFAGRTFEEFRAQVKREPFPGGKYIVNGDTPIADAAHAAGALLGKLEQGNRVIDVAAADQVHDQPRLARRDASETVFCFECHLRSPHLDPAIDERDRARARAGAEAK